MRFDIVTLFPELFTPFLTTGVTRRAYESGSVAVHTWNPRDWAQGQYRRIDDRPFGGGPGMVMMAEPLARCVEHIQAQRQDVAKAKAPVVLFSPLGQTLTHTGVQTWAESAGAILICGRYEGLDQRFIERYVDVQISLGDFVLSGGEIAAMALLDAVARLQPSVLGNDESAVQDSFHPALDGLLDCPHYTQPAQWQEESVPPVLLSGHHVRIQAWQRQERLRVTQAHRPDLLAVARREGRLTAADEAYLKSLVL